MTVCVAVKLHDCIVFAADSASSPVDAGVGGQLMIANVYAHGNKVFNLRKGLPIAAMTCGMGNIGPVSIGTLAKDLRLRFCSEDPNWRVNPDNYTIEEIAQKARRFFFEEHYQALPVVFDVKMPRYEYSKGEERSLSVDRPNKGGPVPADCLANLAGHN